MIGPRSYCEEDGVVELGVVVAELVDAAAGTSEGEEEAVLDGAAAAGSLFSPVLVPPVSPPVLDGGLSLSE
jgi:hypothetical protein